MRRIVSAAALAALAGVAVSAAGRGPPAPELTGISAWVNSEPLTLAGLKGRVVVLHFWTNGCINCVHNYPVYRFWQDAYAGKKVTIVGVHTPEFDAEKDLDRLKRKARENGLTFPVAVDNEGKTWAAWGNRYWPAVYLIDKAGRVRDTWEGEVGKPGGEGDRRLRRQIDALLAE